MMSTIAKDPVDEFLRAYPWVVPLLVVGWGCLVMQLVARLSGWSRLAEQYRATQPFQGEKWRFQSINMRYLSHYNGCVTFGADLQGLYVAVLFFFRVGHPPLLIPWGELEIQPKDRWMMSGYELRFLRVPGVTMWVRRNLGEKILRAAQERDSGVRVAPQIG